MNKNWEVKDRGIYRFTADDREVGTMSVRFDSSDVKAVAEIEGEEFVIKRTGFWKTNLEVTRDGERVAITYSEKWYASHFFLDYNHKQYRLKIQNNPLAEWEISLNGERILVYGLNTGAYDKQLSIKISATPGNTDFLLDFILWYLFVPIAIESMGDSFSFNILLMSQ